MSDPATDAVAAPPLITSINPATGEIVGTVAMTPTDAIPGIVAAARRALAAWRGLSATERAARLKPAGDELLRRADELGLLLTREMGKPLAEATGEVRHCATSLTDGEALSEMIDALRPEVLEDAQTISEVHFDPLGVCAAIAPWNFPVAMPHSLVIPALVAGNTVVLKPSEETPLIAQAYAEVLQKYLPENVLQIIHGDGTQGRALVEADVDLIAFTGSRDTGAAIMRAASGGLKRLILELGGKDPLIVLSDADIEQAAEFAARNSFRNAGQVCVSTERIYVHEAIADRFEEAMIRSTRAMKVGAGTESDVRIGPMVSTRQRDHVLRQINQAVSDGARVLYGNDGHHGNWIMPTILTDLPSDHAIMVDETFGPVACIVRVKDDDEAVTKANDTRFGLGAAVFGESAHAAAVARRLEAGMVGINRGCGGAKGSPWVGARQSGHGFHGGRAGHRQFTQTRVVSRPRS